MHCEKTFVVTFLPTPMEKQITGYVNERLFKVNEKGQTALRQKEVSPPYG